MKYLFIFFILFPNFIYSQRVGLKPATIYLENFNSKTNDGILTFEIDVKMVDCLSYLELNDVQKLKKDKNFWDKLHDWWWFKVRKIYDFEVSRTFTRRLEEKNYFLKDLDDGSEHIFMKCDMIQLKSVYGRKQTKKKLQINLVSKSGKIVYSKIFILNKNKIIEKGEVRLGIEPS